MSYSSDLDVNLFLAFTLVLEEILFQVFITSGSSLVTSGLEGKFFSISSFSLTLGNDLSILVEAVVVAIVSKIEPSYDSRLFF